ncbi:MAG: ChaN family lipoprotein [Polaromonas sp.]|nr:ChaN family lipoprotein [Polaromonas sp.]
MNLSQKSARWGLVAPFVLLAACAQGPGPRLLPLPPDNITAQTDALLPTDAILLGEQHDAAEHQTIHRQVIAHLAVRGQLGAVALEMAEAGRGTAALKSNSTPLQVQDALGWNSKNWPWPDYGPAVMAAVKAGVPVLGANLPAAEMREAMADSRLDQQLPGPALKAQQQLIRIGHCGVLPESRISPMTRIQIARDIRMARVITQAALPGKVVVLLAGSGHVNRVLGVPQHLPPGLKVKAVHLRAAPARLDPDARLDAEDKAAFDAVWLTPDLPARDYCAEMQNLRQQPDAK